MQIPFAAKGYLQTLTKTKAEYSICYNMYHKEYLLLYKERRKEMSITIAKQADIRANIKKFFDLAYAGETIIVPRKENKNIVILSEHAYKRMDKARRKAEYLEMLSRSEEELKAGKTISKTLKELENLVND